MPNAGNLRNFLRFDFGCGPSITYNPPIRPNSLPDWVSRGDVAFFLGSNGAAYHSMFITSVSGNNVYIACHDPDRGCDNQDIFDLAAEYRAPQVTIININPIMLECRSPKNEQTNDSTIGNFEIRHQWVCCWHERLGGQWPWTSNPTAYACLTWDETRGTTWDTLISPRINLVGCSAVVFIQSCTTNLIHGSGKTIEIRGSTNDGASWTYLIGTDTTTKAELPWASNQRDVRIAWIYKGPVQANRYWCVDDIEILAKPTRDHDICVSEVRNPKGRGGVTTIITQGKTIKPSAFVWNLGKEDESLSVTFKIGSSYTDTKWIKLYPYNDTLLEFSPWTATPGNYTATCYSNLADDEFRGNDTATLNFKVAADTWVKMFPVYNGGVQTGACITSTGQETLFCVTGRSKFFASYLISQDL